MNEFHEKKNNSFNIEIDFLSLQMSLLFVVGEGHYNC